MRPWMTERENTVEMVRSSAAIEEQENLTATWAGTAVKGLTTFCLETHGGLGKRILSSKLIFFCLCLTANLLPKAED